MLQKTVNICGKDVNFRSSASVPRLYRAKFGRDIFKDLSKLEKAYKEKGGEEGSAMEIEDLEIFENVAYIMAFHADPSIPKTIDEWLEQFDMFSIYEVLPEILELWGTNLITDVEAKKTKEKQPGNNDGALSPSVSGGRAFPFGSRPSHHRNGAGYLDGEGK